MSPPDPLSLSLKAQGSRPPPHAEGRRILIMKALVCPARRTPEAPRQGIFRLTPALTKHFSWRGPGNKTSTEFVYGVDFRCVLHILPSRTRWVNFTMRLAAQGSTERQSRRRTQFTKQAISHSEHNDRWPTSAGLGPHTDSLNLSDQLRWLFSGIPARPYRLNNDVSIMTSMK